MVSNITTVLNQYIALRTRGACQDCLQEADARSHVFVILQNVGSQESVVVMTHHGRAPAKPMPMSKLPLLL